MMVIKISITLTLKIHIPDGDYCNGGEKDCPMHIRHSDGDAYCMAFRERLQDYQGGACLIATKLNACVNKAK